jgi:SulP family sulfate permease
VKLPRYSFRLLAGDLFGGIIAALIALPYGLAMATLMGLPPVLGLFTSLITAPITALLGRNPVLIGGTSTVTVPFIALAVQQQGIGGAAKVTLVAAVFMMVFSVVRLGRFLAMVPPMVVSGFSCGIGAMMIIAQLKTILGLNVASGGAIASITQLINVLLHVTETRWQPLLLAAVVIAAGFVIARYEPRAPAPLIGVAIAIVVAKIFSLHEAEVGSIPVEIPAFAGFTWSPADIQQVLPSGLMLALVTSVNLLITSRVVEHFRGRHRPMKRADADAELGAYGIANIAAGIFGAPMSVGIPARSLANVRCGGTTRVSNIIHGLVLFTCLSLGASIVSHIPMAALGGVTAYVGVLLLDWGVWRRLPKMSKADASMFLTTAFCTLLVNAAAAVAAGCVIYGIKVLRQKRAAFATAESASRASASD